MELRDIDISRNTLGWKFDATEKDLSFELTKTCGRILNALPVLFRLLFLFLFRWNPLRIDISTWFSLGWSKDCIFNVILVVCSLPRCETSAGTKRSDDQLLHPAKIRPWPFKEQFSVPIRYIFQALPGQIKTYVYWRHCRVTKVFHGFSTCQTTNSCTRASHGLRRKINGQNHVLLSLVISYGQKTPEPA